MAARAGVCMRMMTIRCPHYRSFRSSTPDYTLTVKDTHTRLKTECLNFWEILAQAIASISPSMTAALISAVDVRHRRQFRMVMLSLRHHHAAFRGDEPESICQAVYIGRQHV